MALNSKQKLFVGEYLVDKNATRAAQRAGYGKTEKTWSVQGSRLLGNAEIKAAIEKGLAAQEAKIRARAERKGLTKERWLQELQLLAFANMDDFATVDEEHVYNGEDGEPVMRATVNAKLTKNRPRYLGRAIKKLSETKNGIGLELHSKQAALELIGKHMGWVKNELGLNLPPGGVQVVLTMPSNGYEASQQAPTTNDDGDDGSKET